MGRNLIPWVRKTCGHRQADSGKIKPGSETVNNPDPDSFRPQNQRSRPQNPQQTRPQPPVERGWADKADSRPPLRGPGGWGGDWYVWHAPDGPRARAATALGCVQAGAEKLGVIEASYASAIIGVLSPVSSHCFLSPLAHFGCTGHWSLSSRPTPHALRSLGPPSLPRAEPVPALPTRQEVNMLRHATFSGFGSNLARLVFGVSCCKISPCVCFSLDSRGPRLWP